MCDNQAKYWIWTNEENGPFEGVAACAEHLNEFYVPGEMELCHLPADTKEKCDYSDDHESAKVNATQFKPRKPWDDLPGGGCNDGNGG